jgi:rubredoxin
MTVYDRYDRGLRVTDMGRYECLVCGYIYDPAVGDVKGGIPPGVSFADLPEDWVCPDCGVGKDQFVKVQE